MNKWKSFLSQMNILLIAEYYHTCRSRELHVVYPDAILTNTTHWYNVWSMFVHRLRRWSVIEPALGECIVFAGIYTDFSETICWSSVVWMFPKVCDAGTISPPILGYGWCVQDHAIGLGGWYSTSYSCHTTHGVAVTLNRRQWRWFNVATTSCAQWD